MMPKVTVQRAADPMPLFMWNTYREVLTRRGVGRVIGCGIRLGKKQPRNRYLSVQWRRP